MMKHNWIVDATAVGQRLDLFLRFSLPSLSRAQARTLLDNGKMMVNGEVEFKPNRRLRLDDKVEVSDFEITQKRQFKPWDLDLEIVYQDDDLLVVDKPTKVKVHPISQKDEHSLLNALYFKLKDKISVYGLRLINRIDADTSGLVMVALSPQGGHYYSRLFAESRITKQYLLLVDKRWGEKYGYEEILARNFLKYDALARKQKVQPAGGEFAETSFKMLETKGEYAVLRAVPRTGRTHQLRVQLAHLGFAIIGDTRYAGPPANRLMLHSYSLEFDTLAGKRLKLDTGDKKEVLATQFGIK